MAYNHNLEFSYAGSDYVDIYNLPREVTPKAYDFAVTIYPEQEFELKKLMMSAKGNQAAEFMTQRQVSYSGATENKEDNDSQKIPFSIATLIKNSRDPGNVEYYTRIWKLRCLASKASHENEKADEEPKESNKKSKYVVGLAKNIKSERFSANNKTTKAAPPSETTLKNITALTAPERQCLMPHHPAHKKFSVVETQKHLVEFLKVLKSIHQKNEKPNLFFRSTFTTKMTLFSIFVASYNFTWVLNIQALGNSAFEAASEGSHPISLRKVLKNQYTPKLVYDVSRESRILFNEYKITLRGTIDIEILYFTRYGSSAADYTDLHSLFLKLPINKLEWHHLAKYKFIHQKGLCSNERSEENVHFLAPSIREAAIAEVQMLAPLFVEFTLGLSKNDRNLVAEKSKELCKGAQGGQGGGKPEE